jgi:hypothetical protein
MYLVSDCGSRPDSALHGERSKESWHDVQLLPIRLQHDYALATILCTIEFPNGSTIWETPENSDDRHSCIQSCGCTRGLFAEPLVDTILVEDVAARKLPQHAVFRCVRIRMFRHRRREVVVAHRATCTTPPCPWMCRHAREHRVPFRAGTPTAAPVDKGAAEGADVG